jgi:hypothetical protein
MRWLSIPFVFLLTVGTCFSQDLDQLRSRVTDHWKKRAAGDRKAAAEYIARANRERFIALYEPQIKSATIDSFRFLSDPKEILVVVKAKIELPIGVADKTISERWIWEGGNWLVHVGPLAASPFVDLPSVTQVSMPALDLLDAELNVGRHVQGEQIPLSVRFKAKRAEVANIRVRGVSGITDKGVQWENPEGGTIDALLDTSLFSTDISQDLTVELISVQGKHVLKTVKISGAIDGRVRIKQTPEIIDPAVSSRVEVELTNISTSPVKLAGLISYNPAYRLEEVQTPIELKPGESRRLQINHEAQRNPDAATLFLDFADRLFPRPLAFPLTIKMPVEVSVIDPLSFDPALLDQIRRLGGPPR